MSRKSELARIHIGKKELGLDDDDYRAFLERVTGEQSAADLDGKSREMVIKEMQKMGVLGAQVKPFRKRSQKPYVRKIFALWGDLKRQGKWRETNVQSLKKFVKKMTGKDDPEWLNYTEASKVIEALKNMEKR